MDQHGNTALPVSPVVEDEMDKVRGFFNRVADAVVAASSLRGEIENLRHVVEGIQHDLLATQARNRELDEQVSEVRRQRDEAITKLNDLEARTADSTRTIEYQLRDITSQNEVMERQRVENQDLKRQRDDAIYAHMEIQERLDKVTPLIKSLCDTFPVAPPPQPVQEPVNQAYEPGEQITYNPSTGRWS